MSKTAITITTINVPEFLHGLCKNISDHGHANETSIFIIADKKTPSGAEDYCNKTSQQFGVDLCYLDIEGQEKEFENYQALLHLFPYNTPDRVILGGMLSYLRGYDRLIAVDDDNYTTENDFVGSHKITGTEIELNLIDNDSGWYNVHNALIEENNIPFYPRGYPWAQRNEGSNKKSCIKKKVKIIVNQGLVLEDPDIDAISRLAWPIRAMGMNKDFDPQFALNIGVWSPFNYQNTSLCRDLIPCYYRPLSALRNADIWTAYVFNKLGHHFGDVITFGQPLVKQLRNVHDLWDDLDVELINNRATDDFISLLRGAELTKNTYFEALGELLTNCQKDLEKMNIRAASEKGMIQQFFVEYQKWYEIVADIINK